MRKILNRFALLIVLGGIAADVVPQSNPSTAPSEADLARAEKAFEKANGLMEGHKYADALVGYKEVLTILPNDNGALFNAGLAAYQTREFALAVDFWKRLKLVDSSDWHARAKLIQSYQALGRLAERDTERSELFDYWKSGKNPELSRQIEYCREQFQADKLRVMAFEHFELKGERALRYVFSVLAPSGDKEDFRISLGSYAMTNAIWRDTTKPKPKEGERLFHLDGYFKWGHATYGFFTPEPSYEQVRAKIISILTAKDKIWESRRDEKQPQNPKPE